MTEKAIIMDENSMQRAITRITYEILERNKGANDICLVGILSRGRILADRIAKKIFELEAISVNCGCLDVSNYRDDEKRTAVDDKSSINFDITNRCVIIVDDVIYTGRTARASLDAIIKRGRPKLIQLAVLIDRGHRELPIRPDYVGKNLPTSKDELVRVKVREIDSLDKVAIVSNE
ncbi:MAG: bifunctional pyr operon transcriptional regulator/uracil phosphoribosyltransferase PyrR [Ruminococcus sp.]|nr:bifunctional pyr operon transcriptional regulator/uracil phosphoribosyltransferase PyrR [Ruminococcus sp.]